MIIKNPWKISVLQGFVFNYPACAGQLSLLEAESKFVDEDEIIINFGALIVIRSHYLISTLEIITGKEITRAQHIGQVVGDFVSTCDVNFHTVGTVAGCIGD